ncbi:MAG: Eco57I restriction-modification methylase domain-containing protein [Planctomycetes bacterium]|nr:Eco57I restriction-modification methylase domain-containing protein [Planctomycetota bacterium]
MMTTPPAELDILIQRFSDNQHDYRSGSYNETELRREFLDPLFELIGWDVNNRKGYAQPYKEVVHEDKIKSGGTTKAPDYGFRIGKERKFFLEAKKPSIDLHFDADSALQLRRYGYSAKLPLSILSNFMEFSVYDCRKKPTAEDKAANSRIEYLQYKQYPDKWEYLVSNFSPEAIRKGAFDKYAVADKNKRGTAQVDDAFLEEIERWRVLLAKDIARNNPNLGEREVNFAVQRTIDRIVFLRICEDRGIEPFEKLRGLRNGENVYSRLFEHFQRADGRYNSGLFHFMRDNKRPHDPDDLTPNLNIDDKTLKDIIGNLYFPESPYEFSVFPADILGQVYERFLGKVIRLTKGHQAKVEEKPEVRKAGGVYYTPTYIVDYIVKHTVGKLVEGRTPQEISGLTPKWNQSKTERPLTVLDPACGSGSFLLGAYDYLLGWYEEQYLKNVDEFSTGKDPKIYRSASGEYRLTIAEKKRILLTHIYGVDIDSQAIETTKLSLLLKVLEGYVGTTTDRIKHALREHLLPDLGDNIKCGNSLIGPDFYDGQNSEMGYEERLRINAFDWNEEFKSIMQSGGFDAVIGNPPYIRMEAFKQLKDYLRKHYKSHNERSDLYVYFIECEHKLLRDDGMFGMIVSNKFLRANYGHKVREIISDVSTVHFINDLAGLPVFKGATVRTIVLITCKSRSENPVLYAPPPSKELFTSLESGSVSLDDLSEQLGYQLPQSSLGANGWALIDPKTYAVLDRCCSIGERLVDTSISKICMGIKSGLTSAFVIDEENRHAILNQNPEASEIIYPFLQGRQIRRFKTEKTHDYLIYTYHGIDMNKYPAVLEHLKPFKKRLEARATKQAWYELQQPQFSYREVLEQPKIVFPDIATGCRFALDTEGHFVANTVYFLPTDDAFLLGLLNSRLAYFYFAQTCAALEGAGEAYLRFFGQYLENFPVKTDSKQKQRNQITELVRSMIELNPKFDFIKTSHEKTAIQRQIDQADKQIDRLVYELYGLTEEEIKIVEEATSR